MIRLCTLFLIIALLVTGSLQDTTLAKLSKLIKVKASSVNSVNFVLSRRESEQLKLHLDLTSIDSNKEALATENSMQNMDIYLLTMDDASKLSHDTNYAPSSFMHAKMAYGSQRVSIYKSSIPLPAQTQEYTLFFDNRRVNGDMDIGVDFRVESADDQVSLVTKNRVILVLVVCLVTVVFVIMSLLALCVLKHHLRVRNSLKGKRMTLTLENKKKGEKFRLMSPSGFVDIEL